MREAVAQFLAFFRGVLVRLVDGCGAMLGRCAYEEQRFAHFLARLVVVERRIKGMPRRLAFLWRWLRYAIHRYHLLPTWLKLLKLAVVVVVVFGPGAWEKGRIYYEHHQLYSQFYDHYYAYFKHRYKPRDAHFYADSYALQYADYYTSPAYREALRHALPQDMGITKGLSISLRGLQLIRQFEGLMLKPYRDAGGKYTIGYGHLMRASERFTEITAAEAERLLLQDVKIAEQIVRDHVKAPLTRAQFSALVSLAYNIGGYQFRKSTLVERLNEEDYEGAAEEILRWNKIDGEKSRGLAHRRWAEYRMFTGK